MPTRAAEVAIPDDGRKHELVDGQLVVSPAGYRHGKVSIRLGARLLAHAEAYDLGDVLDSSTGFRLHGGNVRCPDVSFVAKDRVSDGHPGEGFPDLVPDLAVEVLSPDDRPRAILDKVGEYLQAGVRLVWVIDPRAARAVAYRSPSDVRELSAGDDLDGEDVVRGFRCRLGDILR
jgi:Uma2 family endonuclease